MSSLDLSARVADVLTIPFHRFLGVRLTDPDDPAAGITVDIGDSAINNAGVMHGGILSALLDVGAYLAVLPHLEPGENAVTHDMAISILRPVPPGAALRVRGEVIRAGRSLVFLRSTAQVGDAVVATGQLTKSRVALRDG